MPCCINKWRKSKSSGEVSSSDKTSDSPTPSGMERFAGRVAVVTGASSGIGAQLAEDLVRAGMVVVGAARRLDRLQALAAKLSGLPGRLEPLQADLSTVEGVQHVFSWVEDNLGGISVLVNNAAIMTHAPISNQDPVFLEKLVFTNVTAVMTSSSLAIQSMKKHNIKDGHIININSVLGHRISAVPEAMGPTSLIAYSTTKHATVALTKGLRADLQQLKSAGFKIRVTSISPGVVNTEMLPEAVGKMLGEEGTLRAQDVSNAILFALSSPPLVEITELTIQPTGEFM